MAVYVGLRVALHGLGDEHGQNGPFPEEVRDKVALLLVDEFPEVEIEIEESA